MTRARARESLDPNKLALMCDSIGNACADDLGFVPVRTLLTRFKAQLTLRPLLVEAMLASIDARTEGRQWTVLVDSDRYPLDVSQIERESYGETLPARLRFTIAHELAHAVAFHPGGFSVDLPTPASKHLNRSEFVSTVESATDRATTSLLLPRSTLEKIIRQQRVAFTAADLKLICRNFGVSRDALINRLSLLKYLDDGGLSDTPALTNVGMGIGEWESKSRAVLRRWPLYINFHENIVPAILGRLAREDRVPAQALSQSANFLLNGGQTDTVDVDVSAGLPGYDADRTHAVRVTTERIAPKPGSRFFFVISKLTEQRNHSSDEIRRRWGFSNRAVT